MKSKYCFLRTAGDLTLQHVIYVVWVGSYVRELTKATLVDEYCKDCGLYFQKWNCLVDSHLQTQMERYRKDGEQTINPFVVVEVSIDKLYRMIIDDSFAKFEANIYLSDFEKWCRYRNTIRYHQSINNTSVSQHVIPHGRKNLSHRNRHEEYKAVMAILAIFGLFLIDAVVSFVLDRLFLTSF